MGNKNCFAYGRFCCRILTERICDNRECTFFKTHKQYRDDMEKYPPIDYKHYRETGEKIYYKKRGRKI